MSMFTLAISCMTTSNLPWFSEGKASAYNAGDPGLIPGLGRSPGEVNGNPLQYSCLKNPMDWEAWWATVKGVAKNRTWLSDFTSLLHGLNIPGSYAILLFTELDFTSITSHIHNWVFLLWKCWDSSWAISNPKRWCFESAALNMPANLENSALATGLEKVNFHPNPKERQWTTAQLHSSHTLVK